MRKSLKLILWIFLPLVLGTVVLTMYRATRDLDIVILRQLRDATGLDVQASGKASFSLLPRPQVRLEQVTINDVSGGLKVTANAIAIKGNLRLLWLLVGEFTLDRIDLVRPNILLDIDRLNEQKPDLLADLSKLQTKATFEKLSGGYLVVQGGNLRVKANGGQFDVRLSELNFKFDWPQLDGPLAFNGRGRWHDLPFSFHSWLANPAQWLAGGPSPATVDVRSGQARASWRGGMTSGGPAQFAGEFRASLPSLGQILPFVDIDLEPPAAGDPFTLRGALVASWREQALSGLRMNLLGSDYEGALALRHETGIATLSGTLATEKLQLSPLMALGKQVWSRFDGDQKRGPAPLWKPEIGLDIRLSATTALAKAVHLDDVALGLRKNLTQMDLELSQAQAFGGTLASNASLGWDGANVSFHAIGRTSGTDLSLACLALQCAKAVTGKGETQFEVSGNGNSKPAFLASLSGEGQANLVAITLPGLDFAQALRRVEKRSWPALANLHDGSSAFDSAIIQLTLQSTTAIVRRATFVSDATRLELVGSASLDDKALALTGVATQTTADKAAPADAPQLRFHLRGPLLKPAFTPQLNGLMPTTD